MFGSRLSLSIAFISVAVVLLAGSILGMIAAFFGRILDDIIMRTADIFMSVPNVILGLALAVALAPGVTNVIIVIVFMFWPPMARLVRGTALAVRERMFVEAARAIGVGNFRLMFKHILPNCFSPVLVQATIQLGWATLMSATLSFIGVGVQRPLPEWGLLTATGRMYILNAWWYATFPGLAIVLLVLAFNFIGDFLRDFLDPYQRSLL